MNFGKAFTFAFEDPDWLKKILINGLIGLIPFVGQIYLMGWGLETARRIAMGGPALLPDVDFGTYLGHGFRAILVSLIWTAPILLVSIVFAVLTTLTANADPDVANAVGMVGGLCVGIVGLVFGIALGVLLPVALTRATVFGSAKDGLALGAVWRLFTAAPGPWLLVLVGNVVAGMAASLIGSLACGVGIIFTMTLYQAVMGHFFGQAYTAAGARA